MHACRLPLPQGPPLHAERSPALRRASGQVVNADRRALQCGFVRETLLAHIPLPDQRRKWAQARSGFSEADLANATDKIVYALKKIEAQLGETPWLAGETYSTADINFFSHCGMMVERMFPEMDVAARYPRLIDWRERVKARRPAHLVGGGR